MPKICVFKKCKSDQRRHPWIKWATFVSPLKLQNVERAKKWLQLVGRPDYTIERLKLPRQSTNTFICEDHFPEEDHDNLDWKTNPNLTPFPADTDMDALHMDSSEIDEEIANPPLDKNDMKTDKHFKKNMKKEKHFKKKDFKANFPMVRKYYCCQKKIELIMQFFYFQFRIHKKEIHGKFNQFMTYNFTYVQFADTQILQNKTLLIMLVMFIQKLLKILNTSLMDL